MAALPPGFKSIRDTHAEGSSSLGLTVNLLGLVVSFQPPRRSKGTDWCLNFTIQDDFTTGAVGGSSSISCRVFKPSEAALPKITAVGDVVILRNFKLSRWNDRLDCVSSPFSATLVFPSNKIPVAELSQAYFLGTQYLTCHATANAREADLTEQKAILRLKHSSSGSAHQVQHHAAIASINTSNRRKEALIKDLTFEKFYDLRVEVINIYYSHHGTVDLKVTDYTANKDLYDYADPDVDSEYVFKRDWRGPYGQVTLAVRLYEPHAAWARQNIASGDFIHLRNVHIRIHGDGRMEGALHEDRQMPNQIDVRKMVDERSRIEIIERKEAYEQQRSKRGTIHVVNAPKKTSAKASAKRKADKREKQRLQKAAELKEIEQNQENWEAQRTGVNLNIRAAFAEIQPSTISEILNNPYLHTETATKHNPFTLPFVNCRHRSRVKVVDFFPPELEYFTHSMNDPSWTPRSMKDNQWEWGFVLLLEDANVPRDTVPEQLRMIVNHSAAQHLGLGTARDLTAEPKALAQLKEKLFILWGNLAELKEELRARSADLPLPPGDNRLDNKPFDCIIEEYGVEVPVTDEHPEGWQRLHKLALTKIMS